ncbi:MAG: prepilin peptidase [Alkaliphilus sp.]|nr:MAG: prepilin peptidase [Alkaliphilus sp.]
MKEEVIMKDKFIREFKKNPAKVVNWLIVIVFGLLVIDDPGIFKHLKGFYFAALLISIAFIDIKYRKIPSSAVLMIMIAGIIDINIVQSILGLVFVPLPFFIMAYLKENSIGGGDIKLMAACGFFLGISSGVIGSVIGLTLAVLVNLLLKLLQPNKNMKESFPLAPYLGFGCLVAFFLI